MRTYLLTWNPARFPWGGLADEARLLKRGEESIGRWSCGNSRRIRSGDRLFMIKQGRPPRGIVAAGWATSDVFVDQHWDPGKRRAGMKARYVEWRLDTLLDPAADQILGVGELTRGPLGRVHWRTQTSGILIPEDAATLLEKVWADHLARIGRSAKAPAAVREGSEEYEAMTSMNEVELLKRITVNPHIFSGKPIIRGRRLAVEHVLGMLAAGDTTETILDGYPWLEKDDIQACLVYARRLVANERLEAVRIET
jgi:uncharacterized protein (DUF433 family)